MTDIVRQLEDITHQVTMMRVNLRAAADFLRAITMAPTETHDLDMAIAAETLLEAIEAELE